MPTVSNHSRPPGPVGAAWRRCAGCADLFPGAPDQTDCRDCTLGPSTVSRREAAHPADRKRGEAAPAAPRPAGRPGGGR
jgi:hypothetical protein